MYWAYPTGPFNQPNIAVLNPGNGNVENASDQPLATYNPNDPNSSVDTPGAPPGKAPDWCPSQVGSSCGNLPADFPQGLDLQKDYMGNVSTVGQDETPSPWGTYDQGGNVVEILDTLAPQPPGYNFLRDWHYYHGGVVNAPAYQLEISAFGYFPGHLGGCDAPFYCGGFGSFIRVKPPAGAPNVLLVLIDDAGFGNPGTFGGPIDTPNYDRMASPGLLTRCESRCDVRA